MTGNTSPLLLTIGHQLEVANLLKLQEMQLAAKTEKEGKALRRIAEHMDRCGNQPAGQHSTETEPTPGKCPPNTFRKAAGLPQASEPGTGAAPALEPDWQVLAQNWHAIRLELLWSEVHQLLAKATEPAAVDAYSAVLRIIDRHTTRPTGDNPAPVEKPDQPADIWIRQGVGVLGGKPPMLMRRFTYDTDEHTTIHKDELERLLRLADYRKVRDEQAPKTETAKDEEK